MLIKIKCPCETYANACCACVSMHCDKCIDHSKFQQGSYCSHCGRPLKAELQRNYVPRAEVERLEKENDGLEIELENMRRNLGDAREGWNDAECKVERLRKILSEYEETSGLKQAKQEVAMDIFEEIFDVLRNIIVLTEKEFAELKKKYTGEQI